GRVVGVRDGTRLWRARRCACGRRLGRAHPRVSARWRRECRGHALAGGRLGDRRVDGAVLWSVPGGRRSGGCARGSPAGGADSVREGASRLLGWVRGGRGGGVAGGEGRGGGRL